MARITVEDCINKVEGPYDLVLVAKERAVQLNSGDKPNVDPENDKNTVIALKEIAEDKISVKELTESAINKLRKHVEQDPEVSANEESDGDEFEKVYKGEISKSGIPILPSKRARKTPEKIEIFKQKKVQEEKLEKENLHQDKEISLEELKEKEKIEEDLGETENSDNSGST